MKSKFLLTIMIFLALESAGAQEYSRELKNQPKRIYGTDVAYVQKQLVGFGFVQIGEIDGWFGSKTEKGVIRFQRYMGAVPNGVVDRKLWEIIKKTDARQPSLQCAAEMESIVWGQIPHTESDLFGYSSEGGSLIRYTKNRKDLRITVYLYGETGKVIRDFYFCENGTTILFEDTYSYPAPFDIENAKIDFKTFVEIRNETYQTYEIVDGVLSDADFSIRDLLDSVLSE